MWFGCVVSLQSTPGWHMEVSMCLQRSGWIVKSSAWHVKVDFQFMDSVSQSARLYWCLSIYPCRTHGMDIFISATLHFGVTEFTTHTHTQSLSARWLIWSYGRSCSTKGLLHRSWCTGLSPEISSSLCTLCQETQQMFWPQHCGSAIQQELHFLNKMCGLHTPPQSTTSDGGSGKIQN